MSMESIKRMEPLFQSWYVKKQLGRGAYGEVYLIEREDALHIKSSSALKVIRISSSNGSTSLQMQNTDESLAKSYCNELASEIVEEIIIMQNLKGCPNIVNYEDHACIPDPNGDGWIILIRMELLTPLQDYIKTHTMSEEETIHLGLDICSALEACQGDNIIHRDIKPGNIMLANNGSFKLGDFGIARTVEHGTTALFSRKGTFPYMAPEIYKNEEYSSNVDIYSLGIVMYQLLNSGRVPFLPRYPQLIHPDDEQTAMTCRMNGDAVPPPEHGSQGLQKIILKACSFQPADRYSNATEMKRDLQKLLSLPMPQPDHESVPQTVQKPDLVGKKALKPWLIGLIGTAVVGVAVLLLILPSRGAQQAEPVRGIALATEEPISESDSLEDDNNNDALSPDASVLEDNDAPEVEEPVETEEVPLVYAELKWSDWSTTLSEDISVEKYVIACRQVFRSTNYFTRSTKSDALASYVLCSQTVGEYGPWSQWQTTPVYASENQQVESSYFEEWEGWTDWKSTFSKSVVPVKTSTLNVESYEKNENHSATHYEYRTNKLLFAGVKYRYRTRSATYTFYDNNAWTTSEDFISLASGRLVKMQLQYRYAETGGARIAEPSLDNFKVEHKNYENHFADLKASDRAGIFDGDVLPTVDGFGIFIPDQNLKFYPFQAVTIGELVRASVMINRIYNGYTGLLCQNNDNQYSVYADYAVEHGIIVKGEFPDLTRAANRQEMTYILYRALPQECMEAVKEIEAITDMDMSRKYYDCALALARAGMFQLERNDTFRPEDAATRIKAAEIIEKMVHPQSRLTQ